MSKEQEQIKEIQQIQSTTETEITGEEYRDCAKDRLCMILDNAKCEQMIGMEHKPGTNKYCAFGALLKGLGYEYKDDEKFAHERLDINNPHPAYVELACLLEIIGINYAHISSLNDKDASFRDIQRYIMTSH
jgi:hypothetical protein